MANSIIKKDYPDMELSATNNLNDIQSTGFYSFFTTGSTYPTNAPSQRNFAMLVISRDHSDSNKKPLQLVVSADNNIYFRQKGASNWSNWYKVTGTQI